MSAGTGRDAAGVDGARSWRAIHESLSRQRQHPSSPPSHAVAQERQSRAAPKPPPLPRSDYKIILRVRGGLNCAVIHPCVLRQIILKAAGLPISDRTSSDQIRVNSINHTVLISTPDLDRADLYHGIRLLNFNGNHETMKQVHRCVDNDLSRALHGPWKSKTHPSTDLLVANKLTVQASGKVEAKARNAGGKVEAKARNAGDAPVPAKVKIAVVAPIQRRKTTPGQAYHQALLSTTLRSTHTSEEQWEAALRSSRPAIQEAILEWAERVEEDYFK
ncbi:hypothetical protein HPB51_026894 [Rhipicephalus microplus]|uniref:Uncharacterized protein n=1 Tax=Rhipicephalus microplus TaxID=6941 RepID=A0A9J6D1R3_RHIMP|nr:hypothetical protein HPB51_026894 [Rhipicephalus microplus]